VIGAISGALAMGYLVAAFFFLRYWTATRDRLFSFFSTAFFLLCIQRVLLLTFAENLWLYALRLLAFILILLAIADKNRK
jgi:hypothetical protein